MFMNIGLFFKIEDLQESSKIINTETGADFIEIYTHKNIYYVYPKSLCIEDEMNSDRICFEKLWELSNYIAKITLDDVNKHEKNDNFMY